FYGTPATGAGWIVPKKYVERVGDDGFKKAPIGAGPYKFVSFTAGVELVLEACEPYWRKTPSVKRLVFKAVPEEVTRLAMLKRGEGDIAYSIRGPLAEELRRTPGLTLAPNYPPGTFWLGFPEQWTGPPRPWGGRRGWPRTTPSTGRRSTRRRRSDSLRSPAASSRRASSSSGPRLCIRSIRRKPAAC